MYTITTTDGRTFLREASDVFWLSHEAQWISTPELRAGDTVFDAITCRQITVHSVSRVESTTPEPAEPAAGPISAETEKTVETLQNITIPTLIPLYAATDSEFKTALQLVVKFYCADDVNEASRIWADGQKAIPNLTQDEMDRLGRVIAAIAGRDEQPQPPPQNLPAELQFGAVVKGTLAATFLCTFIVWVSQSLPALNPLAPGWLDQKPTEGKKPQAKPARPWQSKNLP